MCIKSQLDIDQSDEECEKLIYESVVDMCNTEWQKTRDIENKATGIVGFVGVIFSLTVASLSTLIASADDATKEKIFSDTFLLILIFLILVFFTSSILCGLMALNVRDWWFLKADEFTKYCAENKPAKKEMYKKMTEDITSNIVKNRDQNEQIAKWLNRSYLLFMISVFALIVYFILLLSILK